MHTKLGKYVGIVRIDGMPDQQICGDSRIGNKNAEQN